MKKLLVIATLILASLSGSSWATLNSSTEAQNHGSVPALNLPSLPDFPQGTTPEVSSSLLHSEENMNSPKGVFLSKNIYQKYFDANPLAVTEFRVNLESFDMEYVLEVQ